MPDFSYTEYAISKIQTRFAKFLLLKEVLINLQRHSLLAVREKASELLLAQNNLEGQLGNTLNTIKIIQSQGMTASNAGQVVSFYGLMEYHMNQVEKLQEAAGMSSSSSVSQNQNSFLNWKTIGLILLGVWIIRRF